jgi:predicted Rossmann fold flavoprotein
VRGVRRPETGGFELSAGGEVAACRRVVVATGGLTCPGTGSSGDGYAWAERFGHDLEPPCPALGELAVDPCFPELAGVSVERAEVSFAAGKRRRVACEGALLFTHAGLSGPAALDAGLELARAGRKAGEQVRINLVPSLTREELTAALVARAREETKRSIGTAGLGELLPVRLLAHLAGRAGLKPRRRLGSISLKEHGRLAAEIRGLEVSLAAMPAAGDSMVTVGGVSTRKVDPRSMESRLVPGLFFAGEVLDPAGPCGGYNLLMAFATGAAAGHQV